MSSLPALHVPVPTMAHVFNTTGHKPVFNTIGHRPVFDTTVTGASSTRLSRARLRHDCHGRVFDTTAHRRVFDTSG
jgi:hypothetical protein